MEQIAKRICKWCFALGVISFLIWAHFDYQAFWSCMDQGNVTAGQCRAQVSKAPAAPRLDDSTRVTPE